jgi:hypothetical protein
MTSFLCTVSKPEIINYGMTGRSMVRAVVMQLFLYLSIRYHTVRIRAILSAWASKQVRQVASS